MPTEELNYLAEWIIDFVERTKRDRAPRDVARLRGVYRAVLGAPVRWGKSDRRAIGVRITAAILPDLRAARGRQRAHLEEMLAKVLALECEEPAFEALTAPWSPRLREQLSGKRRSAGRVFALLVVNSGAFGRARDPGAFWMAPAIVKEYRTIRAAVEKEERNLARRDKRQALGK